MKGIETIESGKEGNLLEELNSLFLTIFVWQEIANSASKTLEEAFELNKVI